MSTTPPRPAVLVTGAGRGLGAVMTERLAHEGYQVFAASRRADVPTAERVTPIIMDVTSPSSIDRAVSEIGDRLGGAGLFGLVNNAAILHAGPLELMTPAQIDLELRTNLLGPVLTTQRFLPLLRRDRGRIVNVGSINAQLPMPNWAVYSASKAALLALSDALRIELAPSDVWVTVLTLGAFATEMRSRAQDAWLPHADDRHERARAASARLVAMLDSTAGDPGVVADALIEVLSAELPPAHRFVGDGIDDLLALAAQPADVRADVIRALAAADGQPG